MLDEQSGTLQSGGGDKGNAPGSRAIFGRDAGEGFSHGYQADSGGASRFFYTAKASRGEREAGLESMERRAHGMSGGAQSHGEGYDAAQSIGLNRVSRVANHHPTVNPIDLMQWLCRLVTPPGGLILDPFAGSGSTVIAALREGFRCIGIEREADYAEIARRRVEEDAPLFQRVAP